MNFYLQILHSTVLGKFKSKASHRWTENQEEVLILELQNRQSDLT